MAQKLATRGGQYPITSEFTFDVANDTMKNTSGVDDNFKVVGSHVFDAILLPNNATVVGGEVVTETFRRLDDGDAAAWKRLLLFLEWIKLGNLRQRRQSTSGAARKQRSHGADSQ